MLDAARVKEMRTQLGENQAVFGARFGVDQSTAHRWETDGPPKRGAARIMLCDLDDELRGRTEEQPPQRAEASA